MKRFCQLKVKELSIYLDLNLKLKHTEMPSSIFYFENLLFRVDYSVHQISEAV
jgi:hypothetical protein